MINASSLRTSTRSRCATPARSITQLDSDFEMAHAVFFKLNETYNAAPADDFSRGWHRRFETSVTECSNIGRQLIQTPAASIAEIRLKLRVVSWLHADADSETLEELDHRMSCAVEETEASTVLAGVQADLIRLTQAY